MITVTQIETAIQTKLESITKIQEVFPYYRAKPEEKFPFACFELSDFDGSVLDVCSNERQFIFNIVVLNPVNETTTRQKAKEILYKIVEDAIIAFDTEMELGQGQIVKGEVLKGQF